MIGGDDRGTSSEGRLGRVAGHADWLVVLVAVVLVGLVRIRLLDLPLERDEGDYAYGGQLLLQGLKPYSDFYTMRMPGIYGVYALAMLVFGQTPGGIHAALTVVNAATIVFVFLVGRRLYDRQVGAAAAVFYAVLSLGSFSQGLFANSEHFLLFFAMAGLAVLGCSGEKKSVGRIFVGGLLLGVGFLVKQHGMFFVAVGAVFVVRPLFDARPVDWKAVAGRVGVLGLGSATPLILVCGLVAIWGILDEFWFWTFRYASSYVSSVPIGQAMTTLTKTLPQVMMPALGIWILAGVGAAVPLWNARFRKGAWESMGLLVLSGVAVSVGLYFRPHYFMLLFPAVALFAGVGVAGALAATKDVCVRRAGVVVLCAAAVLHSVVFEWKYWVAMSPAEVSRAVYRANPFPEALEIARYVKQRTKADDRIVVFGSEPEIYFYANRRAATGHMHMYPLMEAHPDALAMQEQFIAEVEASAPKYVIAVHIPTSWLQQAESEMRILEWTGTFTAQGYERAGLIEIVSTEETNYYWDADARGRAPEAQYVIVVYRRVAPTA